MHENILNIHEIESVLNTLDRVTGVEYKKQEKDSATSLFVGRQKHRNMI